jgi:hypothetical protein
VRRSDAEVRSAGMAAGSMVEGQVIVIDPQVYAKPWTTTIVKHTLLPDTELWEYFCAPTDSNYFNQTHVIPGNRVQGLK